MKFRVKGAVVDAVQYCCTVDGPNNAAEVLAFAGVEHMNFNRQFVRVDPEDFSLQIEPCDFRPGLLIFPWDWLIRAEGKLFVCGHAAFALRYEVIESRDQKATRIMLSDVAGYVPQGWQCPACGRIKSPFCFDCDCMGPKRTKENADAGSVRGR